MINCPISDLDGAGHGAYGGGPEGTLSPAGRSGSTGGVGCLGGPHLPPPGKVMSWSSSSGSLLPDGHTIHLEGDCWGHMYFVLHNFLHEVFHKLMQLMASQDSKFCLEMMQCSPAWGSLLGRCMQLSLPI